MNSDKYTNSKILRLYLDDQRSHFVLLDINSVFEKVFSRFNGVISTNMYKFLSLFPFFYTIIASNIEHYLLKALFWRRNK